ncbi:unnamed protein product, partial [Amoebophrya sp. A25]
QFLPVEITLLLLEEVPLMVNKLLQELLPVVALKAHPRTSPKAHPRTLMEVP